MTAVIDNANASNIMTNGQTFKIMGLPFVCSASVRVQTSSVEKLISSVEHSATSCYTSPGHKTSYDRNATRTYVLNIVGKYRLLD